VTTATAITKALGDRGIPTSRGGRWQAIQVQRLLRAAEEISDWRQITATGGRASSSLRFATPAMSSIGTTDNPTGPDRVRITEAGKNALAATDRSKSR
jgi:hypothetical protein